ncbi:MAG TPA: hypothetical protein VGM96_13750 [Reyranella sp.]|jgi:hypothetical protein
MFRTFLLGSALLVAIPATAGAQTFSFDQAAYVTCREAQAMPPETRRSLAVFLAGHAARRRGVVIAESEVGAEIGYLVRGGCTLSPDSYLFTVIDRAIQAETGKLRKG